MKRLVLALAALVLVVFGVFVAFFTASSFREDDQSFLASLSDFMFMIGTHNARFMGYDPPALSDGSYERFMSHATREADGEVRDAVLWRLERWGAAVEPRLVDEIDRFRDEGRIRVAATALARRGHPKAIEAFQKSLDTHARRSLQIRLVDALQDMGPDAAPVLIRAYQDALTSNQPPLYNLLEAIGHAGGVGTGFLLAKLDAAETEEDILTLQWALAYTRDERAARALFDLMHHRSVHIRRRSRDSMSQVMGRAAIEPALDFLELETDDYLRSWIIQSILASRNANQSPRAVDDLAPLVADPILSWEANYALSRIATDRALDVLVERAREKPPAWVISNLEYSGRAALRILEELTRHEDAYVRRQALWKLEELEDFEAAPIYRAALSDPDPYNRREAERLLFQTDRLLLGEGLRGWLSELAGEELPGRIRSPGRRGVRTAVTVLRVLHWGGLIVSVLVGFLLLIGALRAFEPYKFALVLQFLLVAGVIGDFLLMPDAAWYQWATTARLALLLGILFLRDDPLPGETRGRVERFAVRSLWVLAPAVLVFGVPAFTEALRVSLREIDFMKWVALLLGVLTVLLLEQAVVPWHLFPRGSRVERCMTLALSIAVVSIFVAALWQTPPGGDRATLSALLTLALVVGVLFNVGSTRLFARYAAPPTLLDPPGSIRARRDRESVIVRLKRRRSYRGVPPIVVGGLALWFLASKLDIASGGGSALLLLILTAIFGIVLAWLVAAFVSPSFTIQIRAGAARSAASFLGGVLGRAPWYRRLRLPAFVGQLDLHGAEKRWLARVLDTP